MDVAAVCLLTLEAQQGNGQMIFATPVLQATVGLRPWYCGAGRSRLMSQSELLTSPPTPQPSSRGAPGSYRLTSNLARSCRSQSVSVC